MSVKTHLKDVSVRENKDSIVNITGRRLMRLKVFKKKKTRKKLI